MAWVLPVRSRLSVTACCTGWATVTFGGGGGWGFGCSLQPACRAKSTHSTSQVRWGSIRSSPIGKPGPRLWLTGGRQVVGRGGQQAPPVRALFHLGLDLRWHDVVALPNLPAASQRPVHPDEARRDVAEGAGQVVLLAQECLLSGQHGGEVGHAFPVLQDGQVDRRPAGRDALGQE